MTEQPPLPNLFLLAAPRSGSSQLAEWLSQHPDIGRAPIKEPNHFSERDFGHDYVRRTHLNDVDPSQYVRKRSSTPHQFAVFRSRHDYEMLYAPVTTPWRLDGSTSYLTSPTAPGRLAGACEDPRFILLLRDPVERAISHHGLAVRTGRTTRSLEDELDAEIAGETEPEARYLLAPSGYGHAIDRWLANFPRDRFLLVFFEHLVARPDEVMEELFAWLGIDPHTVDTADDSMRNASATARFARVNRLLQQTGLKTMLRRVVPVRMKRALKPYYFSRQRMKPVPSGAREHLEELLGAERTEVVERGWSMAESWWPPGEACDASR